MCGIAGTYGYGADTERIARRMSGALAHRGPDGEGLFVDGEAGLAHRRLAIIDREHGAQPMTTADGRYTIVYNGKTLKMKRSGLNQFESSQIRKLMLILKLMATKH